MKRTLSLLLTCILLLSVFTGLTLQTAAADAALTICVQYGESGTAKQIKAYTAEELAALKQTQEAGYGYYYYQGTTAKAVAATEYVPLDDLLSDAGTEFVAGDSLKFDTATGPYTKGNFSYDDVSARGVDADGNAVPTAIALCWASGTIEGETTVATLAATATNTGNLRFVSGMTSTEAEEKSARGNRMPDGLLSITIVKPEDAEPAALELYTQIGEAEPVLAKAYRASELEALKEAKAEGYGYYYYQGDATKAVAVTEYVSFDALLLDAGASFEAGDKLAINTNTGLYTKGDFSYEDLSTRGVDIDGNTVPTAIALTWNSGTINEESTFAALVETVYNSGNLRFVSGMTAEEAENKTAAGKRMPTGVTSITVVKPEPEVPAALEVYTKTGEAEPELTKSYTLAELADLQETNEAGYSYVYWKNGEMKTVVATEFVTLDGLLSDAGTTFGAGDELKFTCSDGPYPKGDFHYEIMAERGYDNEGNAVPSAFALTYGSTLEAQENTGKIRFVCGATTAEIEEQSAAGARMPSEVLAVTILKPEQTPQPTNPFSDVAEGAYYYDAVLWAVENGVTKGTSETTFSPAKTCTRAEAVTFLWRAAGSPEPTGSEQPFTDVKEGVYYYNAVLWAVEKKVTAGTSATTFSPNKTCSRAEIVTFLWRAAGSTEPTANDNPFGDVKAGVYYYNAVLWAVENKVTAGTSATTFSPNKTCTRGEIVTFLYRNYQK